MKYNFDYSLEKDLVLKETRGIGFEEIIDAIESGNILGNIKHPNKNKYPNQWIFVIKIKEYVYLVPYVIDDERKVLFLKTFYPNRKATRQYLKNEQKER